MFTFNFYDDPTPGEQDTEMEIDTSSPVRSVSLEEALHQLPDTLAYSLLGGLPRRELWHVKMQIMQNDQDTHLLGQWDVVKGSYEGGLKTWECSVDLAEYVSRQTYGDGMSVLEVAPVILVLIEAWVRLCIADRHVVFACAARQTVIEICATGL
jgi:hypothetical protein